MATHDPDSQLDGVPDTAAKPDPDRLMPGLDEAMGNVLSELDLQSPDMTERGVRQRVMAELHIDELTKAEKTRIKVLLQKFIDEKSAELEDESDQASFAPSENVTDRDEDINFEEYEEDEEPEKKRKRKKLSKIPKKKGKKAEPGKPKHPLSAFMYFSQDRRPQIKNENPDIGFGELGRLLGNLWKKLADQEKKPFIEKAAADKERFDKEMAEWRLQNPKETQTQRDVELSEVQPARKKRKSRKSLDMEPVTEEFIDSSEDEEKGQKELSIFDRVLMSMKSGRRRRKKIEMSTEEMEAIAPYLIERMGAAFEADEQAFRENKPAIQKVKLLEEVEAECRKSRMQEMLLDSGLLRRFRDWLQILPDGSLPNLMLRTRIYELLEILPIDSDYLLESEGFGKLLMDMWKNKEESSKNRQLLRSLIEKWSRPMMQADTDYRKIHDYAEKNAAQTRSRLTKLKSSSDRPIINYQSHHAARPEKAVFDYCIMPQSRVPDIDEDADSRRVGAAGDLSKMARIKKNLDKMQRERRSKQRSVSVKLGRR